MVKRNITITLEKAIEWYNSGDESLKDLALQAFTKEELIYNFRDITTFKKACDILDYNYDDIVSKVNRILETKIGGIVMAWVAVTKQGREFISMCKPIRVTDEDNYYGWKDTFTEISLYSGSIKKLIGRELSFSDDPVELK